VATAIDISNYTGELGPDEVVWLKENAQLVIVRLSTEDNHNQRRIARQQVIALAGAGIPWQGYIWCYWDMAPTDHWRLATELLPEGWPGYHQSGIWLDMEDDCEPHLLAPAWVGAYGLMLRAEGFVPGIYTGSWWIDKHYRAFAPWLSELWAQYPLWFANYNVQPTCEPPGTTPWTSAAMHQHAEVKAGPVLHSYDLSLICDVP
jgi:hypothetical protein